MTDTASTDRGADREAPDADQVGDEVERALAALHGDDEDISAEAPLREPPVPTAPPYAPVGRRSRSYSPRG